MAKSPYRTAPHPSGLGADIVPLAVQEQIRAIADIAQGSKPTDRVAVVDAEPEYSVDRATHRTPPEKPTVRVKLTCPPGITLNLFVYDSDVQEKNIFLQTDAEFPLNTDATVELKLEIDGAEHCVAFLGQVAHFASRDVHVVCFVKKF